MDPLTIAILGGIVGTFTGIGSYFLNNGSELSQLERQKMTIEQQEAEDLALMDLQFETARDEANKNANYQDRSTDAGEKQISGQVNTGARNLLSDQESYADAYNRQMISDSAAYGSALAQTAVSGTRAGSSSQGTALDMQKNMSDKSLQAAEDRRRASDELSLTQLFAGIDADMANIQIARDRARDLRESYDAGGNQFRLYEQRRSNRISDYARAKNDVQQSIDDRHNFWKNLMGATTSALGGASAGYRTGQTLGTIGSNMTAPQYDVGFPQPFPESRPGSVYDWNLSRGIYSGRGMFGENYGDFFK